MFKSLFKLVVKKKEKSIGCYKSLLEFIPFAISSYKRKDPFDKAALIYLFNSTVFK